MSDNWKNLTARQEQAVLALAVGASNNEAAKEAEVRPRTVRRWIQEEEHFSEAVNEARREAFKKALGRLQNRALEAVDTLREVHVDKDNAGYVRVQAAKSILEMALKATEQQDIVERLERLEEQQNG